MARGRGFGGIVAIALAGAGCRLVLGIGDVEEIGAGPIGGDDASTDGIASDGGDGGEAGSPGSCPGAWCWENPLPQGANLTSVWANGANDVWMVGDNATALHYDGKAFAHHPIPVGKLGPSAIYASGPDDAWVISPNGALRSAQHWNGTEWSTVNLPVGQNVILADIWGAGKNDIWIIGVSQQPPPARPLVLHYDGTWSERAPPYDMLVDGPPEPFREIRGGGANDVWMFNGMTAFHWNGSWSKQSCQSLFGTNGCGGTPGRFTSVSTDLWLAISNGADLDFWVRRNGAAWALETSKPFTLQPQSIAATSAGDLWFTTFEQGTSFYRLRQKQLSAATSLPGTISAIAATTPTNLVGVGQNGRLAVSDGESWSTMPNTGGVYPNLTDVASAGGETIAVGTGSGGATAVAIRKEGAFYAEFAVGGALTASPSVWLAGNGPTDAFLSAKDIYRSDGKTWKSSYAVDASITVKQIRGRSASDVWAVGSRQPEGGGVVGWASHFDGSKWTDVVDPLPVAIDGLWVDPAGEVWIFAASGAVSHGGPSVFTPVPAPATNGSLRWISGSSGTDVWIAAQDTVYRWTGAPPWKIETPPPSGLGLPSQWISIAARTASDVWALSQTGRVAHWDGTKWAPDENLPSLNAIAMTANGAAIVVGPNGALLRHDP